MPPGGRRAALFLMALCGGLLVPAVIAAPVAGDLTLKGPLRLPTGAEGSAAVAGLIFNDTANLSRLTVDAPTLRACRFESTYTEVGLPEPVLSVPSEPKKLCALLHDARASMSATDAGWVGLYGTPGARLEVAATAGSSITPRPYTPLASIGARGVGSTTDGPERPWYYQNVTGRNLLWSASGVATYDGPGKAKFLGPSLYIESAEGSSECETGTTPTTATQRLVRWCHLEWDSGVLTLETSSPFDLAARSVPSLRWDGRASLPPATGELRTATDAYEAADHSAILDGRFTATLAPHRDGAKMRVEGDLRDTTLSATARSLAPAPLGPAGWLPWVLVGAVAVGAGGGMAAVVTILRRRHKRQLQAQRLPFTVEDCEAAASACIVEERFAAALAWIQRARLLSPTSARLVSTEAFCHDRLGNAAEALQRYEEAHRLSTDGDAALNAARILRDMGDSPYHMEELLRSALRRSPELVVDLREEFPDLETREDWKRALREAGERYEGEWTGRTPR